VAEVEGSENKKNDDAETDKYCTAKMIKDKLKKEKHSEPQKQIKTSELPYCFRRIGINKPSECACKDKKKDEMDNVSFRRMMLHTIIIFHKASPCLLISSG